MGQTRERSVEALRSSGRQVSSRRRIRITIASDSPVVRTGLRAMLAAERDITIVGEAATVGHARRLIVARRPDVLLVALLTHVAGGPGDGRPALPRRSDVPAILITRAPAAVELWPRSVADWRAQVGLTVSRAEITEAIRRAARRDRVVGRPGLEQSRRPVAVLSVPELAVLRLLSDGRTNREIAHRLRYSIGTVKDYVQRILEKLEASNRTEAAVKAVREGVLS
jgi:DNA-binding NarL/FixJ family response regulator